MVNNGNMDNNVSLKVRMRKEVALSNRKRTNRYNENDFNRLEREYYCFNLAINCYF